jgi:predicted Rossmann-fold nucleotide-binding protein
MPKRPKKTPPAIEAPHLASDQKLLEVLPAFFLREFLDSDEARPLRIIAEYLEPLRRFRDQQIQDTVVFFGSARVDSRARALRALATLRARGVHGADEHYEAELTRSRKAVEWARFYEEARELARLLTTWTMSLPSEHHRFVVTSGGGPGIMEAANRGAREAGGKTIGLNIRLPFEQGANPFITDGLHFEFHYFFMRKFWFAYLAKALVIFPFEEKFYRDRGVNATFVGHPLANEGARPTQGWSRVGGQPRAPERSQSLVPARGS